MKINPALTVNIGSSDKSTEINGKMPKIGDLVKGEVLSIKNDTATLKVLGQEKQMVLANMINSQDLKNVSFSVTAIEGNKVWISPQYSDIGNKNNMSDLLNKMGILDTLENREIVKALQDFNLPLTKENYQLIKSNTVEVKALVQELNLHHDSQVMNTLSKILPSDTLKDTVIKLMNSETVLDLKTTENAVESKSIQSNLNRLSDHLIGKAVMTFISEQDRLNLLENLNTTSKFTPNHILLSDMLKTMPSDEKNQFLNALLQDPKLENFHPVIKDFIKNEASDNKESQTSVKADLSAILSQFNIESSAKFIKENIPLTFNNLLLKSTMSDGFKSIGEGFSNIAKWVEGLAGEEKQQLIAILNNAQIKPLEQLESLLKLIDKSRLTEETKEQIKEEVSFIKNASTLIQNSNDQIIYLQMPIKWDKMDKNVALYVKTRHKKINPEDMTLMVSLNTNHYGEVRCVIHKMQNSYTLSFKFDNETILGIFENEKEILVNALYENGYTNARIQMSVLDVASDFQLLDDDYKSGHFDVLI